MGLFLVIRRSTPFSQQEGIIPYGGAIHHHETTPDTVIMNTTFQKFICLITRTPQRNRTPSTRMMKEASPIHPYNKREKSTSCSFECTVETDRQHFFIFDPIYFVLMMNLVTQRSILFCSILFSSLVGLVLQMCISVPISVIKRSTKRRFEF